MSSKQAYNNLLQEWFVEQTKEIFWHVLTNEEIAEGKIVMEHNNAFEITRSDYRILHDWTPIGDTFLIWRNKKMQEKSDLKSKKEGV
jgi:hypothetical protein